ncbi:MAG TPA: sigma-70 family RNA polymerase sigma factor [Streptosporangiaceae bacterium]|nr:sigma-70 family RNA polymerase sigma factor [Streptosporangiaceae bacterium]
MIGEDFPAVLAAAQQGDEAAFAALWHDGQPALLRYLHVLAPDAAEDIAAETWTHVVRGLARFRGTEQNWRAWLFTTARRRVIDQARQQIRRPATSLEALPETAVAELAELRSPDAADLALDNLATLKAIAVIASLPPMQAEVVMLRVVAGLDNETVAQLLGRTPGAIRVAAHRGLQRLASLLAETGVTL